MKGRIQKYHMFFVIFFIIQSFTSLSAQQDYRVNPFNKVFLEGMDKENQENGANEMLEYFKSWSYPYEDINVKMRLNMITQVESLPKEQNVVNNWYLWGPRGAQWLNSDNYISGRITDICTRATTIRVSAASGGIWQFFFAYFPISDNLHSTLAIGSFDTKPNDDNIIIVATGEPRIRPGAGMYKTIDGGLTYTLRPMSPFTPNAFFRVRYDPNNTQYVHAGSNAGYFRSTNGGDTWTNIQLTGEVTDLAFDSLNNIIYAPVWGDGLYKSYNNGSNWSKITTGGIPLTNFGRTTVGVCKQFPDYIYINVAKLNDNNSLGVYKSADRGLTWTDVSPPGGDFMWGQGFYNSICAVNPINPNHFIVGGGKLLVHTGLPWPLDWVDHQSSVHADDHAVDWNRNGSRIWVGSDGGLFRSDDGGFTFVTVGNGNGLPITQYTSIDVSQNGVHCYGGSQDNGITGTSDRGLSWWAINGADGGGVSVDPNIPGKIAAIVNTTRYLTNDGGFNWNVINNGITITDQFFTQMRNDKVAPVYLYNNSGPHVYKSVDYGTNWTKLNSTPFPKWIRNMSVSKFDFLLGSVVYACLDSTNDKLRVYDNGTWFQRTAGLPMANYLRKITPHPTNRNIAYAVMDGLNIPGQKIYKTMNAGINWINISGNIPDIPLSDIVPHPTNNQYLYLGTEMGCYKTTNGGQTWQRWNNGMHDATIVTEMIYIDSLSANSKYYIVAATYGRSIYLREISGDDPININGNITSTPNEYELFQNYPNPFNPITTIKFNLPIKDKIDIGIYDIQGKRLSTLLNQILEVGEHKIKFNGANIPSGVYFYKLTTSKISETKKMILIK